MYTESRSVWFTQGPPYSSGGHLGSNRYRGDRAERGGTSIGWYLWTVGQAILTAIRPDGIHTVGEVPAQLAGDALTTVGGVSQQDVGDVPRRLPDDHRALRGSTEVNGRHS